MTYQGPKTTLPAEPRGQAMSISVADGSLPTAIRAHPTGERLDDVLVALRERLGIRAPIEASASARA